LLHFALENLEFFLGSDGDFMGFTVMISLKLFNQQPWFSDVRKLGFTKSSKFIKFVVLVVFFFGGFKVESKG
jgi:hypothetical protein